METRKSALGLNPICMLDLQYAVLSSSMEITMIVLRMLNLQVLKPTKKHKFIYTELPVKIFHTKKKFSCTKRMIFRLIRIIFFVQENYFEQLAIF